MLTINSDEVLAILTGAPHKIVTPSSAISDETLKEVPSRKWLKLRVV